MQTIRTLVMIQCASFDSVNETGAKRQNDIEEQEKVCAQSSAHRPY